MGWTSLVLTALVCLSVLAWAIKELIRPSKGKPFKPSKQMKELHPAVYLFLLDGMDGDGFGG